MTVNNLSGGPKKTRKRKPKKTPSKKVTSNTVSSQATEDSNAVPGSDVATVSQSTANSLPSTPKRSRRQAGQTQEASLTSTPVNKCRAKQMEPEYFDSELITQLKVFVYVFF